MSGGMRHALTFARQMGIGWVAYRSRYLLEKKFGVLERRTPAGTWRSPADQHVNAGAEGASEWIAPSRLPFAAVNLATRAHRLPEVIDPAAQAAIIEEAHRIHTGTLDVFGRTVDIRTATDWHRHPVTGAVWPQPHWSRLNDAGESDVKWLWEPARFRSAFLLTRAYWLTRDDAHVETFWSLVESWRDANPPNLGAHWMCGQEASIRVIAWAFAAFAMMDAPPSTPARLRMLTTLLSAHGKRIEANLDYALSQKNNHGVNEALGLWTIGVLFPGLPDAARWASVGRRLLEDEGRRQFYADGAYVQQSLSYHRFVLQSYAWALLVGSALGQPFSEGLTSVVRRATRFLHQLTDPASGRMPNYGANDSAVLLPLSSTDAEDPRPALALAFWATDRRRAFDGPTAEALFWLADSALEAPHDPVAHVPLAATEGGYYTLRSERTWAFTRCGVYRDRPSQADMLHVDIWWRGVNIVADPGTFAYTGEPPWNNGLVTTAVHNAVTVDGLDQMERVGRFAWARWNRGRVVRVGSSGEPLFEGEHDGYVARCGVTHRRAVVLVGEAAWVIIDDLNGAGTHTAASQWLFPDACIISSTRSGAVLRSPVGPITCSFFDFQPGSESAGATPEIAESSGDDVTGWFSPRYAERRRAAALIVRSALALPARRITVVALEGVAGVSAANARNVHIALESGGGWSIALAAQPYAGGASVIQSCTSS